MFLIIIISTIFIILMAFFKFEYIFLHKMNLKMKLGMCNYIFIQVILFMIRILTLFYHVIFHEITLLIHSHQQLRMLFNMDPLCHRLSRKVNFHFINRIFFHKITGIKYTNKKIVVYTYIYFKILFFNVMNVILCLKN